MTQSKMGGADKATGEGDDTTSDVIAEKCLYSLDPAVQGIFAATRRSD